MSFYMHLESENSNRYFPSNTSSSFQYKLPTRLEGTNYEVALLHIGFVNNRSLFNHENDRHFQIYFNGESHKISIPQQKYNSIQEFVTCLSELIEDYTETIKIVYRSDQKVCIKTINSDITVSECVAKILGMEDTSFPDTVKYGKYEASLNNVNRTVYISMNDTVPQLTGGGFFPFLNVMCPSNTTSVVEKSFNPIMYIPLQPYIFDSVHIKLLDSLGRDIYLPQSETQVLLHFRRKDER